MFDNIDFTGQNRRNTEPDPKHRIITRVSPSQISAFISCNRSWFWGWILKFKSPPTESQRRGTRIHAVVEEYELGRLDEHGVDALCSEEHYLRSARAAIRDGEIPTGPELQVEERTTHLVLGGDVKANGIVDLIFVEDGVLVVRDYKSCKTFNYCKDPEQLEQDTQCVFYCNEVRARGWDGPIVFEHFYLSTQSAKYRKVRTKVLTPEYLDAKLRWLNETVLEMKRVAQLELFNVSLNTMACRKYGGCFHKSPCDRVPFTPEGVDVMATLNFAGKSPLAKALGNDQPAPPTRLEVLVGLVQSASVVYMEAQSAGEDAVELTQATFHEDLWALAEMNAGSNDSTETVLASAGIGTEQLDALTPEEWDGLADGMGTLVEPAGINPPDATPNHHPAPGEESLRELGMGGRSTKPLERNNIVTMGDLIGYLSSGKSLSDLDGVGTTAEVEGLSMAVQQLLKGVPQVTQFDPDAELQARNAELAAQVGELSDLVQRLQAEQTGQPVVTADSPFICYVDCGSPAATPASQVLAEMAKENLAGLYAMDYSDGKKEVAKVFIEQMDVIKTQYPGGVSFQNPGGFFEGTMMEVLLPAADEVVR